MATADVQVQPLLIVAEAIAADASVCSTVAADAKSGSDATVVCWLVFELKSAKAHVLATTVAPHQLLFVNQLAQLQHQPRVLQPVHLLPPHVLQLVHLHHVQHQHLLHVQRQLHVQHLVVHRLNQPQHQLPLHTVECNSASSLPNGTLRPCSQGV